MARGYFPCANPRWLAIRNVSDPQGGRFDAQTTGGDRRIPDKQIVIGEISAREEKRNLHHIRARWPFTTEDAHVKLTHLYTSF